ncbi:10001_t:CDS:2, partial [Dentiscutata heterogama]
MSLSLNNSDNNNENSNFIDMINNYDWSSTSLGPMHSWEPQFRSALQMCLKSIFPTFIYMGPDWTTVYNEAAIPTLKSKHPHALGKPAIEIHDYPTLVDRLDSVRASGKGIYKHDFYFEQQRDGYKEETYIDYALSPIFKLDGTVWGVISIAPEVTENVLNNRRLKTLGNLSLQTAGAESLESACHIITKTLQNNKDIPYSLIYLVENHNDPKKTSSKSLIARLVSTTFDEDCKEEFIHGKLKRHIPDYFPETHET